MVDMGVSVADDLPAQRKWRVGRQSQTPNGLSVHGLSVNLSVLIFHLSVLSSPLLERTPTPEWVVDDGVNLNEDSVLPAVGAGAAVERDMAAALPPPPPLPATALFRCPWRTDARRRRRALPTAFRQIFSVSSAWSMPGRGLP